MSYQNYMNFPNTMNYMDNHPTTPTSTLNSSAIMTNDNGKKSQKRLPAVRNRVKENSRLLPQYAIDIMTKWYDEHYSNPYPTFRECEILAEQSGVSINQVKQWFVNVRRRSQNEFRRRRSTYTKSAKKSNSSKSSDDSGILNEINVMADQYKFNESRTSTKQENITIPTAVNTNDSNGLYTNYYNQFYNTSPQNSYSLQSNFTSTPNNQLYNNYYNNSTNGSANISPSTLNYQTYPYELNNFYNSYTQSFNSYY